MGRAIKLILYYLAYQLLFIFLATGTDATIALIGGADITANFRPGTIAISIGMLLSALAMTWHLVHFTMSSSIKRVCMKFQKNHSFVPPSPVIRTIHSRNIK